MATFATAVTRLLRIINRPSTEADIVLNCKDALNDAVKEIQRDHAFAYTESLAKVTIPANTLYVEIGTICDGKIRDYMSAQQITSDGFQGKPLSFVTYNQLQKDRWNHYRRNFTTQDERFVESQAGRTIEDSFRTDMKVFIANQHIGVYPLQATDVQLLLNFHLWLPELLNDDDTNFLLDYAYDAVILLALRKLSYYQKTDSRINIDNASLVAVMESLKQWDGQLRETANFTME
jgi:hypothetical protein